MCGSEKKQNYLKKIGCFKMSKRNLTRARIINATIQARVWRGQMKGKNYNTVTKELIRKLKNKYPNLPDIEHIAISVI